MSFSPKLPQFPCELSRQNMEYALITGVPGSSLPDTPCPSFFGYQISDVRREVKFVIRTLREEFGLRVKDDGIDCCELLGLYHPKLCFGGGWSYKCYSPVYVAVSI